MKQNIRKIFEYNTQLLGRMDKTVFYFREQQWDKALSLIADSVDDVKLVIEAIISDREYFNLVNDESMLEMLNGILESKKNRDFVLLADLLELQLINFLIGVQELIISKEEIIFEEEKYNENIRLLKEYLENSSEQLAEPINTDKLLEKGYCIEFTSCGCMTLAAQNDGSKFYFHTNSKVLSEAFLLARQWYCKEKGTYLIYGLGLGYHIRELQALAPEAEIIVYEADMNVIQLACAFTDMKALLDSGKIKLIYDPEFKYLEEKAEHLTEKEIFHVHYPSYKNIRGNRGREIIEASFPWLKVFREC